MSQCKIVILILEINYSSALKTFTLTVNYKLSYNKLSYNKLGCNKLCYNKFGYNKLGYCKLPVLAKTFFSLFFSTESMCTTLIQAVCYNRVWLCCTNILKIIYALIVINWLKVSNIVSIAQSDHITTFINPVIINSSYIKQIWPGQSCLL
jgi:hypothetical protein